MLLDLLDATAVSPGYSELEPTKLGTISHGAMSSRMVDIVLSRTIIVRVSSQKFSTFCLLVFRSSLNQLELTISRSGKRES